MIYVISDLHGYPHKKFLELLDKAGFSKDDFLFILGDVIDRQGDGGIETLQWLLYQTNVQLLMGNHEAALIACSFAIGEINEEVVGAIDKEKMDALSRYSADGGDVTMAALHKLSLEAREDILDYLRECPLYGTVEAGGRDFILVHAGLGNFDRSRRIEDYPPEDLLWNFPELSDVYYEKVTTVFGHRPTFSFGEEYEGRICRTRTWIDIDTGAGYGREPVLLRLDDMAEFRLEF